MGMDEGNLLERMWEVVKGWAVQNSKQYLYLTFPATGAEDLAPDASYFRVWLKDMNLLRSRAWFTDQYPAVHASVKLKFNNHDGEIFSRVAQPSAEVMGPGVRQNYVLLELMPFAGGVVELEAGLFALRGKNYLATTIGILDDFSKLIGAPLTPVMDVVKKVTSGLEHAIQTSSGQIHLAFHQAFRSRGGSGSDNVFRPGYHAIVLATREQLEPANFSVAGGQLLYRSRPDAAPQPLRDYEYMLIEIEGRKERDDWKMKNLAEPLGRAIDALTVGDKQTGTMYRNMALGIAWKSPDLATDDRRRVVDAIKKELASFEEAVGQGAAGVPPRDLNAIMEHRAMSRAQAAALGEMTFEEVFA